MNKNEGLLAMLNIENIYEEVFTRKGMGLFMRMAWLHIRDESDEKDLSDISYKLMIEELMVYGLATQDEKGYNKMIKVLREKDKKIKIKPYKEMMEISRISAIIPSEILTKVLVFVFITELLVSIYRKSTSSGSQHDAFHLLTVRPAFFLLFIGQIMSDGLAIQPDRKSIHAFSYQSNRINYSIQ